MNFSLMLRFSGHLASIAFCLWLFSPSYLVVLSCFFIIITPHTHSHSLILDRQIFFFKPFLFLPSLRQRKLCFFTIQFSHFFFPLCFRFSFFIDDKLIFVLLQGEKERVMNLKIPSLSRGVFGSFQKRI